MRVGWTIALLALTGCSGSALKKCAQDSECGTGAYCDQMICVLDRPGGCGPVNCTATQRCTPAKACVADLAPVLTVAIPDAGAFVASADYPYRGDHAESGDRPGERIR